MSGFAILKGVAQKLGQGDSGVERQSGVPFERRTDGGTTVTATDLVSKFREAEHGRVQCAENFVGGLAALGAVGYRLSG